MSGTITRWPLDTRPGTMNRYKNDHVGSPWRRRTTSPSWGPSSRYAIRKGAPPVGSVTSAYCGSNSKSGRPMNRSSGVRTRSMLSPISLELLAGHAFTLGRRSILGGILRNQLNVHLLHSPSEREGAGILLRHGRTEIVPETHWCRRERSHQERQVTSTDLLIIDDQRDIRVVRPSAKPYTNDAAPLGHCDRRTHEVMFSEDVVIEHQLIVTDEK